MDSNISDFHHAVRDDNEQCVKKYLESGIDPNEPDWNNFGRPALIEATYHGHERIVKILLEHGADPGLSNTQGELALHISLHPQSFSKTLVQLLLDHTFDVNVQEKFNGFSPLHIAAKICVSSANKKLKNDMLDVLKMLASKADLNLRGKRGETALHRVVTGSSDWTEPLAVLIDAGADLNVQNEHGESGLMCAINRGHTRMAQTLIEHGCDTNLKDRHFQTALHHSAQKNNLQLVTLLLNAQCELNAVDLNGDTALHISASKGLTEMVKVLLQQQGIELNVRNLRGFAPLHNALESGFVKVIKLLLQADCEIDGDEDSPFKVSSDTQTFVSRFYPEICSMLQDALDQRKDWETAL